MLSDMSVVWQNHWSLSVWARGTPQGSSLNSRLAGICGRHFETSVRITWRCKMSMLCSRSRTLSISEADVKPRGSGRDYYSQGMTLQNQEGKTNSLRDHVLRRNTLNSSQHEVQHVRNACTCSLSYVSPLQCDTDWVYSHLQGGQAKDYQLWVASGKEDSPYPLIGKSFSWFSLNVMTIIVM